MQTRAGKDDGSQQMSLSDPKAPGLDSQQVRCAVLHGCQTKHANSGAAVHVVSQKAYSIACSFGLKVALPEPSGPPVVLPRPYFVAMDPRTDQPNMTGARSPFKELERQETHKLALAASLVMF